MKDLIEDWKQNAKRKNNENYDFLMWLKIHQNSDRIDEVSLETHNEVFSEIKCTDCANCCKVFSPPVNETDIERISAFLQISETEFVEKYLKTDDKGRYEMKALPCPFLKDNKCSIYEIRPIVCQEYPHTNKKDFKQLRFKHIGNTEVCPAVYHILETMKNKFGWRNQR